MSSVKPGVVRIITPTGFHQGSGIIYDGGGLILTALHVLGGWETFQVYLPDGRQYAAQVVKRYPTLDIVEGKVTFEGSLNLPYVTLGTDKGIRVGSDAVALGYALGLPGEVSASKGIISGFRETQGVRLIQVDAAVNPGNSGGPLIDLQGEVIGIITFKYSGIAVEGIAFAVSIDQIKSILAKE